jgi:NAD(P)-dependent dehydrogenase (short-subunit alcohol dehydrogenase family)
MPTNATPPLAKAPHLCKSRSFRARPGLYLITGANTGLGLAITEALLEHEGVEVVAAVRRPESAQPLREAFGARVHVEALDVGSLSSVRSLCARFARPLAGLINNAGQQNPGPLMLSNDGLERTFAVNYLGALALTLGLMARLRGGRVLFVGSGTHDQGHPTARLSGFRGSQFDTLRAAAVGVATSADARQAGLDRYATSKLLCTSIPQALAARYGRDVGFYTFDPGMMPGTGLARAAPAHLQFAWKYVLPGVRWALPDTTSPRRSGVTAAWLASSPDMHHANGSVLAFDGAPSRRVSAQAKEPGFAQQLLDDSVALMRSLGHVPSDDC